MENNSSILKNTYIVMLAACQYYKNINAYNSMCALEGVIKHSCLIYSLWRCLSSQGLMKTTVLEGCNVVAVKALFFGLLLVFYGKFIGLFVKNTC